MHICFVTFGDFSSHSTLKRATGMASPLLRYGCEVSILIEDSPDNLARIRYECPGVQVRFHHRSKWPLHERREKMRHLKELNPDIVWICGVGLRNWILKSSGAYIVLGDHSELLSGISTRPFARRLWDALNEWCHLLSFDGHVCASRYLETHYKKNGKKLGLAPHIHYSTYAYNSEKTSPNLSFLSNLRNAYGDKKVILYMGSFWENYGFYDMLHAFKCLHSLRQDFTVLMMGKGPEKDAGISWIENNGLKGVVNILGFVAEEELPSYFEFADAFLCPLRNTVQDWARCPSKLYMYLPYKKPIITCPVGEAIELLGTDGFFYEPGKVSGLVAAMLKVLDLGAWEPHVDPKKHSWDARAEEFLEWLSLNKDNFSKK